MRPLSIIIPHRQDHSQLETTLLSVLESRPKSAEIIVVDAGDYQDPYGLGRGEAQLLGAPPQSTLVELIERGLQAASADIVHLLEPGLEVAHGWVAPAMVHFEAAEVSSVAPVILEHEEPHRVVSSGLRYSPSGRRRVANSGAKWRAGKTLKQPIVGPHWSAAFYRRDVLWELMCAGQVVGDKLADLDWALSLARFGHETVSETASAVYGKPAPVELRSIGDGRHAQRLYLRHSDERGWGDFFSHASAWMGDFIANVPLPASLCVPFGRILGCLEPADKRATELLAAESFETEHDDERPLRRAA